jgi:hypothetical protein
MYFKEVYFCGHGDRTLCLLETLNVSVDAVPVVDKVFKMFCNICEI